MDINGFNTAYNQNFPQDCGYLKVYEYKVPLDGDGVYYMSVEWAAKNCKNKWGWYFSKHAKPVMTFEDSHEMLLWALRWQAEHRKQNGTSY